MIRAHHLAAVVAVVLAAGWGAPVRGDEIRPHGHFNRHTMETRSWARAHAARRPDAVSFAGASIGGAIAIDRITDLDFGEVMAGGTPGTVILAPDGTRSPTGGARLGTAGTSGAATFSVSGAPLAGFSIMLPASLVLHNVSEDMLLDAITSTPSGVGLLDGSGQQVLRVGATLNVGANQPPGTYSRVFHVTVAYN